MMKKNSNHKNQRGNAFIFILLGIVLFAALSFTIARGMRGQTTHTLSERDAQLAAQDILSYSQQAARAVDRVRRRGCSENQISFENSTVAGYENADAPGDNSCHIFHPNGGSISWRASAINAAQFEFSGSDSITGLGTATFSELIISLNLGDEQILCETINKRLGLGTAIQNEGGDDNFTQFTGTFTDAAATLNQNAGVKSVCIDTDGTGTAYRFYSVLLER